MIPETSEMVSDALHSKKAEDAIINLQKWLRDHPDAIHVDRAAAENAILDLTNALGGR